MLRCSISPPPRKEEVLDPRPETTLKLSSGIPSNHFAIKYYWYRLVKAIRDFGRSRSCFEYEVLNLIVYIRLLIKILQDQSHQ